MKKTEKLSQCNRLIDAGLQSLVLLPDSDAYTKREASYWAANVALHPKCIVQPRTSDDVSRIIKVLASTDGLVAVRSGGHTQWAGSNDIDQGVTVDLGQMTNVTFDAQSKLASLQPGSRWGDIYEKLLKHSVCVTGGRDGNVGIGGFLTGGGNSYYAGLYGLACDANAESHSDLWTALKGGSGNFGIVTRFDMYTFPAVDLWGGLRVATRSEGDRLAQSMVDFTNDNEKNREAAYIISYTFGPSAPDVLVAQAVVDTKGVVNASAFKEIQRIPVIMDEVKRRSMADMANTYLLPNKQQYVRCSSQLLLY
jgi:hypothetical protein